MMWSKLNLIHRPQFTVARLMVLVAILGLFLGGARCIKIIVERRANALKHEHEVKRYKEMTGLVDNPEVSLQIVPYEPQDFADPTDRQPARAFYFTLFRGNEPQDQVIRDQVMRHREEILAVCRDQVEFHERMRRKWSRAAWFPWQPVEPDEEGPQNYGSVEGVPGAGSI